MQQSVIRKESYNSVQVFRFDRELLNKRIGDGVAALAASEPSVVRVVLFGSVATGRAVPGSDADLLIAVSHSDRPFPDRQDQFRSYFEDLGVPVDLFVYTENELADDSIPKARTAQQVGRVLFDRQ